MKTINLILVIGMFTLASCKTTNEDANTPEAFQDKDFISDVSSLKRSYESKTDQLYKELIDKNESLKKLEEKIIKLNEDNYKNNVAVNKFLADNEAYYNEVIAYATTIQDSLLREKIMVRINLSEENYKTKIETILNLKEKLNTKIMELNESKTALKIALTNQSITDYQDNFKLDSKPFDELIKRFDELIIEINTKIE